MIYDVIMIIKIQTCDSACSASLNLKIWSANMDGLHAQTQCNHEIRCTKSGNNPAQIQWRTLVGQWHCISRTVHRSYCWHCRKGNFFFSNVKFRIILMREINYSYFFLFWNQYEALAWLCGGLSFFASLGLLAVWNDKASKIPFVSLLL